MSPAKVKSKPTDRQRIVLLERKLKRITAMLEALAADVQLQRREQAYLDEAVYELKWGPQ